MPSLFSSEPSLKSNWHSLQRDLKSDLKGTMPTSKSSFHTFVRELEKSSNAKTGKKSRPMLPTEKGGKRLARVALNEGLNYFSSPSAPKPEEGKNDGSSREAKHEQQQQKKSESSSKRGSLREKKDEQPQSQSQGEQKNQRGHLRQREWAREEKEAEARKEREAAASTPSSSGSSSSRSRVASVESCPPSPSAASTVYESAYGFPPSYELATGREVQDAKCETGVVSKVATA